MVQAQFPVIADDGCPSLVHTPTPLTPMHISCLIHAPLPPPQSPPQSPPRDVCVCVCASVGWLKHMNVRGFQCLMQYILVNLRYCFVLSATNRLQLGQPHHHTSQSRRISKTRSILACHQGIVSYWRRHFVLGGPLLVLGGPLLCLDTAILWIREVYCTLHASAK